MPTKTSAKSGARAARSGKPAPSAGPAPKPPAAPTPQKRKLPAQAIANAKAAFKNFSLSKFAGQSPPSNYVQTGQSATAVQQQVMTQNLAQMQNTDAAPRSMTFALPTAMLTKLLPSYNAKKGTVDLDDVLKLLEQNMPGTEFLASGNPTLNRLAVQSQVQQIIDAVKQGAKK